MGIAHRIAQRLHDLGKSERQASLEANLSDSFIRNIRLGRSVNPRIDTLKRLAVSLETNVGWLLGSEKQEDNNIEKSNVVWRRDIKLDSKTKKIAVYGNAIGGENGAFELNGTKLYEVMCPPKLSSCAGAYAIEISGNSMSPRYAEGEIAYIDPMHAVNRGDYVVVQIVSEDSEELHAYIKKYLFKTAKELVLEQLNPPKRISFPLKRVTSIHYVVMAGACN